MEPLPTLKDHQKKDQERERATCASADSGMADTGKEEVAERGTDSFFDEYVGLAGDTLEGRFIKKMGANYDTLSAEHRALLFASFKKQVTRCETVQRANKQLS